LGEVTEGTPRLWRGRSSKGGIKAHSSLGEVPDFCRGLGRRESEVAEAGFGAKAGERMGGVSELHPQSPAGFWSWATGGGER